MFLALAIDLIFGEPPIYIHPVVYTGKISEKLIKPYKGYTYGVIIWFISIIPVEIAFSILPFYIPIFLVKLIVLALFLKTTFSIRMLYKIVDRSKELDNNARNLVQQIVRRDLSNVSPGYIASAAIESLFESLVDGIISPLFWFLILGLPGAMLQRLANTMDSMVGYKTKELYKEGYFSAKVDTIMNYIPARLAGLLMIIAGKLLGIKKEEGNPFKFLKDTQIESINARYPICIASALLGVKLEKKGYYTVGEGSLPGKDDIEKSLKLFKLTLILFLIILSTVYYSLYGFALFSYPYGIIKFL
ncbi:adenosylcobinamide-phosphate synthase [Acidianus sp. HS-5]|nr:adenosylcobinamide-phosphate synthase [Acidianus sp. HS-5]